MSIFDKSTFLYNIAISHDTPMDNLDDISLSINLMLEEIRSLGYEEFHSINDVKLRKIKDPRIMKILLKYYDQMDLYTKDSLMYKINPKYYPEILSIAKKEFLSLRPSEKMNLNGFQTAMSKGLFSDAYINEMYNLLNCEDNYAYLSEVRKKFCKEASKIILPFIEKNSKNVLVICAIQDSKYLPCFDRVLENLTNLSNITEEEIKNIKSPENNNALSVTTYEYYNKICTVTRIKSDAAKALKKLTST